MQKRSIAWPGLLLGLLLPFMAACGGGLLQKSGNTDLTTHPAGGQLYVLDNYTGSGNRQTAQHIVALPAGTANPTIRLMLPAGLTDLKHQRLYVAYPIPGGSTSISVIDTGSGATMHTFSMVGSYSTADRGNADSMLSGDGRWLALRAQNTSVGTTSIALVDTQAGKLVKNIHLTGDFTLDAVSPRGTMLYLVEYYQAGTSHYNVRAYDVNANRLLEGSIVDKAEYLKEQSFTGLAESSDGQTLYGVDPTIGITLLDPGSGVTRAVIRGVVKSPWGIEWAT